MRGKLWLGAAAAAMMALGATPAFAQSTDQPGDASTTAVLSGDIEGDITPAGDTDWFRLNVTQGQRYSIALAGVPAADGATLDPMLGIYDAEGNQLAFNDDANESLNAALNYTPTQSGTVFVEARAFSPEATGGYRLGVLATVAPPDDFSADTTTRGRLTAGRSVGGELEFEGDTDWFRFTARTGNRYRIRLDGQGGDGVGLGDPLIRVIDDEGNELAVNDDANDSLNSEVEFIPRENGNFYVEASGFGGAQTGRYSLTAASERLPRDSIGNNRSTGGRIRTGQSTTSSLDFPSDTDWYRVQLQEGQSYRFTLNSDSDTPLSDPLVRLYNANGDEIAIDDDGGDGLNSYLEYTADRTGVYFVEAAGFGEDAQGGYTLSAREGDIPADNSTDASLAAEGDYREGVLGAPGDRDWYRVELTEGQGMRVGASTATTTDALGDPLVVIYGPDGSEVARDDDGGDGLNAWLEYSAATAGTHYVEVRGFVDDAVGRYVLTLNPGDVGNSIDGAEALMTSGDGRVATIGANGDVDWFVTELIEGRPYRINVESFEPDPLADPYLTIYDSQGNQIATDDDGGRGLNAYLNFTSVTGGPYFFAVSSFNDSGAGRYQIRVVDTDVPGNPYTDELLDATDDARASRIEMPGDLDYYRVTLEAGATYVIEANGVGATPLGNPSLAVFGDVMMHDPHHEGEGAAEDAGPLASDEDSGPGRNARLRYRAENAGDVLIRVSGAGNSTGDYEVKIVRQGQ